MIWTSGPVRLSRAGPTTTSAWIRKYIFPGGYTPALSEVMAAIEKAGLWVTDVEILRPTNAASGNRRLFYDVPNRGSKLFLRMANDASGALEALVQAREEGMDVHGPFAPDTVFMRARQGAFDVVVAMYHDQGLIPVKLLGLDHGVNTTLGLPLVRTSPDHGTAFDIAGTGRASPSSLLAAIDAALAASLTS